MASYSHTQPSASQIELAQKARAILEANIQVPLTIPQVAEQCSVSPTTLKEAFRATIGTPLYRWYRSMRMSHAQQLLETTQFSVAQIAADVGYSNPSKFAKAFAQTTGMSPRAWRSTHAQSSITLAASKEP